MQGVDFKWLLFSSWGRIGRQTYWLTAIGIGVLEAVVSAFASAQNSTGLSIIAMLVAIAAAVANIFVGIKRCHDRDRSGWFLLVGLIPVIGGIWLLVELGFLRGTIGPNRFGPDPAPRPEDRLAQWG
jgi:uncharacterized membrane protein YhaH (DUF805 family)